MENQTETIIMKYLILLILSLAGSAIYTLGQQAPGFSLTDVIRLAQSQSPKFRLARTQKEIKWYEYLSYKSDLRPQISLYGNAPVYSKEYISVVQPDGSIKFQPVQQNSTNLGLSLSQVIPFTGGQLSLNTAISQFYDFQTKFNQYNGTPLFLQLNQPIFSFNELKWKKKVEPLKLEESRREFVQEMENIAQQAVRIYFDVLDAESNIHIAAANLANTNTNYEIEKKRIDLGTTTEDKLLQLELLTLRSRQDLEKARYDYKIAELALRTFIGIRENKDLKLLLPEEVPLLNIQLEKALGFAKLYRPEFVSFERKRMEAERDVAQARAAKQQVNLTASYGLNRAAGQLGVIYSDPMSQQTFSIGINMPLIDWGRRKARYNTAQAQEKQVIYTNELDQASIEQEVTTLVDNIELLKGNIQLARITDSVGLRRYALSNQLYQSGKLTVTELNVAQSEKDNAQRSYVSALREYWNSYYLLRRLTIYDFEKQQALYKNE
jgi:outer membrane protein TolC